MKIGDLVKVEDKTTEPSIEIQEGMIGAIFDGKYWIFNNEHSGNRPENIEPETFGYKYSWVILKKNIPANITIALLSIDDYNKKELEKV